jgi:DNA-binding transcriptional ArsR family regulator
VSAVATDRVFAALADRRRRTVLELLARDGPRTATMLASRLRISRQAVAKHCNVLRSAKLIRDTRAGRERQYEFVPDSLSLAQAWMARAAQEWDARLARLKALVEGEEERRGGGG